MIDLPDTPGPVNVGWAPVDFGGRLTPPAGGAVQRMNRNGNRWSCSVQLPTMEPSAARPWIAALTQGLRDRVSWKVRQVEFDVGAPGSPTVDGDGQAGTELAITGASPNYAFRAGQWISVETGGVGCLYMVCGLAQMDASGAGTLTIEPPLRVEPADGDAVSVGVIRVEGLLDDGGVPWTIDVARRIGLSFTITEDE